MTVPSTKGNRRHNGDQGAAARPSPDSFIGGKLGNCEIREKMNEGGTAFIYKAYNPRFEIERVVKVLKPSLSEEEDFYERFTQEAQLTARLDHPNILRVYDTGEADGYFYIEMEYIAGQTLRQYIQSAPRINEREVLRIAAQVAAALNYAHTVKIDTPKGAITGILHRDIKPENIMITADKVVKLMDFGAAKPLNITSNTMQGMIVGTFHYMSPEQLEGKELDVRSDFFSLGIVLYESLTGVKPFVAANLTALIERVRECKFERPRKVRPSITPMTEELIEQLLSRHPEHRPRSAREIHETVETCIQAFSAWGAGRRARTPFSVRRLFPGLSLLISLCALGVSLLALFRQPVIESREGAPVEEAGAAVSLLEKGREIEKKGMWREAAAIYELAPSVEDGGPANEYLEAQLRRAYISFKRLNQYTLARSILEKLRLEYSDPAIDAYLGQIYFKLALYIEARDRLDAALSSNKGSVIAMTHDFKREMLYYYANALDRQYIYVERNPSLLMDAIKAWDYYSEFSACAKKSDEDCRFARERKAELEQIEQDLQRETD
jgi:tRNA A-37 threonylcarbamoyl transferase component Bud32